MYSFWHDFLAEHNTLILHNSRSWGHMSMWVLHKMGHVDVGQGLVRT